MSLPLVVASGEIRGKRLHIHNRPAFDASIAELRPGLEVEIEVSRLLATRSQQQNKYYWAVVIAALCDLTGYTPEEMHDVCKFKFLPKRFGLADIHGDIREEVVLPGSTRRLNTAEFSTYVEQIKVWAADELSIYIPDPGELGYGAGV